MRKALPVLALFVATGLPLAACAQQSGNAAENGPPPALLQARAAAKTAAFNDLTPSDRAKVQAIIDQVNNGQLTDLRGAASQIDAILSPAETKAVLAERTKMMESFRANMPNRADGAGPGSPGPNGGPPNGAPGDGGRRGGGNHAGRFILQLGVSPDKMRELRQAQGQTH
ncbi:MAG: hypothetical protein JWN27_3183 [Candidatus Eremiobacteraeota bacterium]|jgi:hypothetical protein|nr:hypothetical protein [Candidatus Eremiobacteraeota bacterium]